MPRLYGLRRRQAALAPTRAALVLAMGLLLGAMLTMLLQTAGEADTPAMKALHTSLVIKLNGLLEACNGTFHHTTTGCVPAQQT